MFEPLIRMYDSAAGAGVGAYTDGVETAAAMMHQGAHEGSQIGGTMGSVVGGTVGVMYGAALGFFGGMYHGALVGAKAKLESKTGATGHDPHAHHDPLNPMA